MNHWYLLCVCACECACVFSVCACVCVVSVCYVCAGMCMYAYVWCGVCTCACVVCVHVHVWCVYTCMCGVYTCTCDCLSQHNHSPILVLHRNHTQTCEPFEDYVHFKSPCTHHSYQACPFSAMCHGVQPDCKWIIRRCPYDKQRPPMPTLLHNGPLILPHNVTTPHHSQSLLLNMYIAAAGHRYGV